MKKKILKWRRKLTFALAHASVVQEDNYSKRQDRLFYFGSVVLLSVLVISIFAVAGRKLYNSHVILSNPQQELNQLRSELSVLQTENERLNEEQGDLTSRIQEQRTQYIERLETDMGSSSTLLEDYFLIRNFAGFTSVEGDGIRITVQDKEGIRYDSSTQASEIVHDQDLQFYTDWLKTQNIHAIQVNGERLSAMSPLLCVGSSVLVNRVYKSHPFVIEAVGNDVPAIIASLEQEIQLTRMRERGLRITIEHVESMTVNGQEDLIYVEEQINKLGGLGNG